MRFRVNRNVRWCVRARSVRALVALLMLAGELPRAEAQDAGVPDAGAPNAGAADAGVVADAAPAAETAPPAEPAEEPAPEADPVPEPAPEVPTGPLEAAPLAGAGLTEGLCAQAMASGCALKVPAMKVLMLAGKESSPKRHAPPSMASM